jgi:hypothetical protein
MRERPLMTPQEIQRTMDFILRSQADSVIRMERMEEDRKKWEEKREKWEEKWEAQFKSRDAVIQREIRGLAHENRELAKSQRKYEHSQRKYEQRLRTLEERDRRTRRQVAGIQTLMRIITRLADTQSKRLDELQKKSAGQG